MGERGENPVSRSEGTACGIGAGRKLAHEAEGLGEAFVELAMLARIDAAEVGHEHGAASSARGESPLVRRGVDPARQAAHDGDPFADQIPGKGARELDPFALGAPRADDRDDGTSVVPGPAEEDRRGRTREVAEPDGIVRMSGLERAQIPAQRARPGSTSGPTTSSQDSPSSPTARARPVRSPAARSAGSFMSATIRSAASALRE